MELDKITAKLRPRSPWEAIDLGLVFLQANARIGFFAMFIASLPGVLITAALFWWTQSAFAFLIYWWLKPLYDRVILHHFAQVLFGTKPSNKEILLTAPKLLFKGAWIQSLTWQRFDFTRSFNLPVWLLEGLRGKRRFDRVRVLQKHSRPSAFWLTVVCLHFVMLLQLSAFGLIALFIPEQVWEEPDTIFWFLDSSSFDWVSLFAYVLADLIIEPLYVAAGFMLYLNRRTELEGWDIEVAFKRLAQRAENSGNQRRRSGSMAATILCCCLFWPWTEPVSAQQVFDEPEDEPPVEQTQLSKPEAKALANKVLEGEEFEVFKNRMEWVPKGRSRDDEPREARDYNFWRAVSKFFGVVFEFGIWVILGVLLFYIYLKRDYWLRFFQTVPKRTDRKQRAQLTFVDALEEETLPEDIAGEARTLWQKGERIKALSLLYRGTLLFAVDNFDLPVRKCHTESEFLNKITGLSDQQRDYIHRVVRSWQTKAYANRELDDPSVMALFDGWSTTFAVISE